MMNRSAGSLNFPMPPESALASIDAFLGQHLQLIEILHAEANCDRWELHRDSFAETLRRSAEKRFHGAFAGRLEIEAYLKSLHVSDLALATACAAGSEQAWEYFIAEFRAGLHSAARAILSASGSPDEGRAAELADSLFAELYGLRSTGSGCRKSLFEYFHGRAKLSTWLRAVLAQRHVDLIRTSGRTISLECDDEGEPIHGLAQRANPAPPDPDREMYLSRLSHALSEALAGLSARERMILACYYTDQMKLAEIGRILCEHESTVSRQLDRIRREIRETVAENLRRGRAGRDGANAQPGFSEAQIDRAFEYAVEDWPFDLSSALSRVQEPNKT